MPSFPAAVLFITLLAPVRSGPPLDALPALDFREGSEEAGIGFSHLGGTGRGRHSETIGSGACWIDHDRDGDIDLYAVNSGDAQDGAGKGWNRLYRNDGGGRFQDVTEEAGLGIGGLGMGCAVADYDNDGFPDLYVTRFGPNVLFRNGRDGTFVDVTEEAGVGESSWSASAGFADFDADGDLDLFVVNYLEVIMPGPCGGPAACDPDFDPDMHDGVADTLYRNEGDGTFLDVSAAAGVEGRGGKGIGVVLADLNQDGWQDIYVANQMSANFLYLNQHDGTFRDATISGGAGFSEDGLVQRGMGADAADVDGDRKLDIVVTNMDREMNQLYLNTGSVFHDASYGSGVGPPGFDDRGFGVDFMDYDNDRDSDLLIVNGSPPGTGRTAGTRSLLANDGYGRFREVGDDLGEAFRERGDGRGLAVGDADNDGDLDFFVVNRGGPGDLFLNEGGNDPDRGGGNWLTLKLVGIGSNRDAIGARVSLASELDRGSGMMWQVDEVRAGSGYLSGNDIRLHFGLGTARETARIDILWPSGLLQTLGSLKANQIVTVLEGEAQATLPREVLRTVSRSDGSSPPGAAPAPPPARTDDRARFRPGPRSPGG